jgi:hypothetical protein
MPRPGNGSVRSEIRPEERALESELNIEEKFPRHMVVVTSQEVMAITLYVVVWFRGTL